jgi:hypothetical protein
MMHKIQTILQNNVDRSSIKERLPTLKNKSEGLSFFFNFFKPENNEKDHATEDEITLILRTLYDNILAKEEGSTDSLLLLKLNNILKIAKKSEYFTDKKIKDIYRDIYSCFERTLDSNFNKKDLRELLESLISEDEPFFVFLRQHAYKKYYNSYEHTKNQEYIDPIAQFYIESLKNAASETEEHKKVLGYLTFKIDLYLNGVKSIKDEKMPQNLFKIFKCAKEIHLQYTNIKTKDFKIYLEMNARKNSHFKKAVLFYIENFKSIQLTEMLLLKGTEDITDVEKSFLKDFSEGIESEKMQYLKECLTIHRNPLHGFFGSSTASSKYLSQKGEEKIKSNFSKFLKEKEDILKEKINILYKKSEEKRNEKKISDTTNSEFKNNDLQNENHFFKFTPLILKWQNDNNIPEIDNIQKNYPEFYKLLHLCMEKLGNGTSQEEITIQKAFIIQEELIKIKEELRKKCVKEKTLKTMPMIFNIPSNF